MTTNIPKHPTPEEVKAVALWGTTHDYMVGANMEDLANALEALSGGASNTMLEFDAVVTVSIYAGIIMGLKLAEERRTQETTIEN